MLDDNIHVGTYLLADHYGVAHGHLTDSGEVRDHGVVDVQEGLGNSHLVTHQSAHLYRGQVCGQSCQLGFNTRIILTYSRVHNPKSPK